MRNFLAFAAVVAALVALVAVAAQYLHLPPVVVQVAVAIGALVIAVRGVLDVLQRLRGPAGGPAEPDPRVAARHAEARRRRRLRRRLAAVVRELRAAQPRPRLWYRERGAPPWWLVVGPAGHGKSALLQAAPDARELAPDDEPDVPRFFTAAGAVFLELPSAAAAAELAVLFARLRRLRPRRPICGALVVHRADELLAGDPDLAAARRQIDVAADALGAQVPVVLVVARLDRLAGLAELLGDLPPAHGALGATLPPREGQAPVQAAAAAALAAPDAVGPVDWVRQRCHALVARAEPGSPRQTRLYGLWQQFARLAERAAAAAGRLAHAPLPGGDPLRLRAVYFTAARPDPAPPEDLWSAALARRVGAALPPDAPDAPALAPAFVAGLFAEELARDAQYAGRLRRHERRRFAGLALVAVALAAVAAAAARGSTAAARADEALVQATLRSAAAVRAAEPGELAPLAALTELAAAVQAWRAPTSDAHLLRGDELADLAAEAYRRAVCDRVLRPLAERDRAELRRFATRHAGAGLPTHDEADDIFARLRAYLLLSHPSAAGERDPWGEDQTRWLQDRVVDAWTRADPAGPDPRRAAALAVHLRLLADPGDACARDGDACARTDRGDACARTGHARAVARDEPLVARVREILLRDPAERDVVERIVDRINRDPQIDRVTVGGLTTAVHVRGEHPVPPAYTRDGWLAFSRALQDELDERSDEPWVLGKPAADETRVARCTRLRELYTARYIKAWKQFVAGLRLDAPSSLTTAAAIYAELGDDAPLTPLFAELGRHTRDLPPIPCTERPTGDLVAQIAARLAAAPPAGPASDARSVRDAFAPLVKFGDAGARAGGLDGYHKRLQELHTAVTRASDPAAIDALHAALVAARDNVDTAILRGPHGAWKDPLKRLLLPPIDALLVVVDTEARARLNRDWCATVVAPLLRSVAGRYPFRAGARDDARLADLAPLLHPQTGEIARFRDTRLSAYLAVRGHDVEVLPPGAGADHHLSGRVRELLDAAHKLGLLLYGGAEPGVELALTMSCEVGVPQVELDLDGAKIRYDCGPHRSHSLRWPGKGDEHRALLLVTGDNRVEEFPEDGEFALLRLLERGQPTRQRSGSGFTVSYPLPRLARPSLKLTVTPRDVRGGNLFHGFGDARFLAPLRAPGFTTPPHALFAELPFTCEPLP
jgi:type VI secretion system protein ImpL